MVPELCMCIYISPFGMRWHGFTGKDPWKLWWACCVVPDLCSHISIRRKSIPWDAVLWQLGSITHEVALYLGCICLKNKQKKKNNRSKGSSNLFMTYHETFPLGKFNFSIEKNKTWIFQFKKKNEVWAISLKAVPLWAFCTIELYELMVVPIPSQDLPSGCTTSSCGQGTSGNLLSSWGPLHQKWSTFSRKRKKKKKTVCNFFCLLLLSVLVQKLKVPVVDPAWAKCCV